MLPLKIVMIWHQHQPYYKFNDEFLLPWVRLHGTKDYFDLNELLHEYPNIKQTVNLVPSLNMQIDDYTSSNAKDRIQILSEKNASDLNYDAKTNILDSFFICNHENMLKPYPRFYELYKLSRNQKYALEKFSEQDWRDLQVWYNLCWCGYFSKQTPILNRFFEKGKNFSEMEKITILEALNQILTRIIPQLKTLKQLEQLEISISAMFHPILPLLINSESILESMPNAKLPEPIFKYPEDAKEQIVKALDYYKVQFGEQPKGFWPPEGALSNKTLEMLADLNIQWTATDEQILKNTFGKGFVENEKFFPRLFALNGKKIVVFFRDNFLSDRIGFSYSTWTAKDASNDFMFHLYSIKNSIVSQYGEEALKYAAVSVILDGENCWEFYKDNGIPFLRELYGRLSETNDFETVTATEAINGAEYLKPLNSIKAGSWINANFNIWLGHQDDLNAWEQLSKARKLIEVNKNSLTDEKLNKAMEHIYIAEGSDWFWWYGPEHNAPNKADFDVLFRKHLKEVYKILELKVPNELTKPLTTIKSNENTIPKKYFTPELTGKLDSKQWEESGFINTNTKYSTMHSATDIIQELNYHFSEKFLFIRIVPLNFENSKIKFIFNNSENLNIIFQEYNCIILPLELRNKINVKIDETMELKIPLNLFGNFATEKKIQFKIILENEQNTEEFPKNEYAEMFIPIK